MFCAKNLRMRAKIFWKSNLGEHIENFYIPKANLMRDIFPEKIERELRNADVGDKITFKFPKGTLLPEFKESLVKTISKSCFVPSVPLEITPRLGRFYPKGFIRGLTGIFPGNYEPCRVIGISNGELKIDFNHPMSYHDFHGEFEILNIDTKDCDMGGQSHDWFEEMFNYGPGMQIRYKDIPTDFFEKDAFSREDENPDVNFYQNPRLVGHVDTTASKHISNFLEEILKDDFRILDLMSSYQSHLPERLKLHVTGLGLNRVELENNPQLNEICIQDLNENPVLPFDSQSFDVVVCNLSVEYLIKPIEVFCEVHRVLRKDGHFVITFSNRWFPPKVIKLWTMLHEYERMGFVLELLLSGGKFYDFKTVTYRNWPRPLDDPHFLKTHLSDPVYIISARAM